MKEMVAASSGSTSLKEYLKRYESSNEEEIKKKKKKKKKDKPDAMGLLIVDEDPIWQKPVKLEEQEEESADEERPQVEEDIEVKRMKRLEQLKLRRPFGAISEDGSGWVSISDMPKVLVSDAQNSDMSPPRKPKARNDTPSPEREPTKSSIDASDFSPPRRRAKQHHTTSPENESRPSRSPELLDHDLSPPRKNHAERFSDYNKKTSHDVDLPPRRNHESSSYRDESRSFSSVDILPPRKTRKGSLDTPDELHRCSNLHLTGGTAPFSSVSDLSPPRKARKESTSVTELRKTGLVSGRDIKEEIAKSKKEELLRFKSMDPSVSGRGANPVYRDKKTGERLSEKPEKEKEKPKDVKLEWGTGLAQKREAEARQQEIELEKAKPFARTRDDPELDNMLKERLRWGDPMAHLVKKKKPELVLPEIGDDDRMRESGFIVPQEIPNYSWLKRGLDAAPNRYGIKPGRHWDGVDRSNGYEKQLFKRTNEKQATEREAYLWSVSEM